MMRLSAWYQRLLDTLMLVGCLLLLIMTVMIGADVVSRNVGAGGVAPASPIPTPIRASARPVNPCARPHATVMMLQVAVLIAIKLRRTQRSASRARGNPAKV